MCRFAAFLSTQEIPLYRFLIPGGNSFTLQSLDHPDGWGIAHYQDGEPDIVKSILPAIADPLFETMCFARKTKLLLGHIRRATTGEVCEANTHPFRYKSWTFIHNGQISNFVRERNSLLLEIPEELRSQIRGATDSEIYFYLFLAQFLHLEKSAPALSLKDRVYESLKNVVLFIREKCDSDSSQESSSLSCLVSDGSMLCGLAVHKNLSYRLEETDLQKTVYFSSEALAPPERMRSTSSWVEMTEDQFVFVGQDADISLLSI